MAHGNYACCAICDSKVHFGEYDDAKTAVCTSCALNVIQAGGPRLDRPEDVLKWLDAEPVVSRLALRALGFSKCFYENPVDDAFYGFDLDAAIAATGEPPMTADATGGRELTPKPCPFCGGEQMFAARAESVEHPCRVPVPPAGAPEGERTDV